MQSLFASAEPCARVVGAKPHCGFSSPRAVRPVCRHGSQKLGARRSIQAAAVDANATDTNGGPLSALTPVEAWRSGKLAFGWSAGGLLYPYYVGAAERLQELNIIDGSTPMAGASAGSLISVCAKAGLSASDMREATLSLAADCRTKGTRFRLKQVLDGVLRELLPADIHQRVNGHSYLAVTGVVPGLYPQLINEFGSREDLIQTMLTSCHIPWYFDGKATTSYRGTPHTDGGITNFLPSVPGYATVRICCLPSRQLSSIRNIHISPDSFRPWDFSLQQMIGWALEPAEEQRLLWLFEQGRQDAETWAVASGVAAAAAAAAAAAPGAAAGAGPATQGALLLPAGGPVGAAAGSDSPAALPLAVAPLVGLEKPVLAKLLDTLSGSMSSTSSASSISSLSSADDEGDDAEGAAARELVSPSGKPLKERQEQAAAGTDGSAAGSGNSGSSSSGGGGAGSGSSSRASRPAGMSSWGVLPDFLAQLQDKLKSQ